MAALLPLLALLVALAAAAYAWKLQQDQEQLTHRLDRYNRALFDADEEIRLLREQMEQNSAALRVELLQRTGGARFLPDTTMREAGLLHPQAPQILAAFHVGGCDDCAAQPDETIAQLCQNRGLDMTALLTNLNQLIDLGGSSDQSLKLPNVSLELS